MNRHVARNWLPQSPITKLLSLAIAFVFGSTAIGQGFSFERPPIDYHNAEVFDPISILAAKIRSGETKLDYNHHFGYLKSVLEALDVPVSSQTLVFSKTSLQLDRISTRNPRSLYFNDDVYVGFSQQGNMLELAATGPRQGATFYTLSQSEQGQPTFIRDRGNCLACHATGRTQNVPGYLVRSVFPDPGGRPRYGRGTFLTDSASAFKDRWGGWYVTGQHGDMRHMGNSTCDDDVTPFDRESGANCTDLNDFIRTEKFLSPYSDIVALLVLQHQSQMHNAIAVANYETRQAVFYSNQMNELLEREPGNLSESSQRRIHIAAKRVVKHLLMCDEFPLTDQIVGSSEYTKEFPSRGKRDSQGRSLRDFDLRTRVFRYPCSYLIHSQAFDGLPTRVRDEILKQLVTVLTGENQDTDYQHISPGMRREILEILRDTKPEIKRIERELKTG